MIMPDVIRFRNNRLKRTIIFVIRKLNVNVIVRRGLRAWVPEAHFLIPRVITENNAIDPVEIEIP